MSSLLAFIGGLMLGGTAGVAAMCLFAAGSDADDRDLGVLQYMSDEELKTCDSERETADAAEESFCNKAENFKETEDWEKKADFEDFKKNKADS